MAYESISSIKLKATPQRVWQALTDPALIKQYLFGCDASGDWRVGSTISYVGEWNGMPVHDKAILEDVVAGQSLKMKYYASWAGLEDKPENYADLSYAIEQTGDQETKLTVIQGGAQSREAAEQTQKLWDGILAGLKQAV